MRKLWLYIGGLVLVAAAAAAVVATIGKTNGSSSKHSSGAQSNNSSVAYSPKQACKIFTLAEAKQILGAAAKGGENDGGSSSDDIAVSSCRYTQHTSSSVPVSSSKSATILVRAPKTQAGSTSNQNQFGPFKPAGVQDVSGYGDSAYWDPQYGQLDILKNNTWYILSSGTITPSQRTLEETKQLADILIDKL